MKAKNPLLEPLPVPLNLTNYSLLNSFTLCSVLLEEILGKIIKQLPPDPQLLLQYSGLVIKNTTEKLVAVTMLKSQDIDCESDRSSQLSSSPLQKKHRPHQQQRQKNFQISIGKNCNPLHLQKPSSNSFKIKKPFKLKEDHEILLKYDGIKLLKRQQLKNMINHRNSIPHNSLHDMFSPKAFQKVSAKINENQPFPCFQPALNKQSPHSKPMTPQLADNQIINKSTKSFSTLPGVKKTNWSSKTKLDYDKDRISGVLNSPQFVNLKDYYKEKGQKNQNLLKSPNPSISLPKSQLSSNLGVNDYISDPAWQFQKQNKKGDETDAVINKLRERKQKFYRTGLNQSNGESFVNTKRQNTLTLGQGQKGTSANNQVGAMVNFDYSGEVMPTVKYDTIKMQPHYQEMEFAIGQNEESFSKKKQRKGHFFRGAINLKLVDHQKFIPHPHYKYEPLVQKVGMLMKESTAYSLKKGVELKTKEQGPNSHIAPQADSQQSRERLNRTAFEFLYNDEIEANKIKYQDFMRFKKSSISATSLHKNPSSRKKLGDQKDELILSKKSIALKGLKAKQSKHDEANNKVYKSENRKALEMLVTSAQLTTICDLNSAKENTEEPDEKENTIANGILTKKSHYPHSNGSNQNHSHTKKKVRIA